MKLVANKTTCRLCGSKKLDIVLSLVPTPLANAFVTEPIDQDSYPLDLMLCLDCSHVQLGVVVDPKVLYEEYLYSTATFSDQKKWHPAVKRFNHYAQRMVERFHPLDMLDIGCNDGTLLRAFQRCGVSTCGVEPATAICEATRTHYWPSAKRIWNNFFSADLARDIRDFRSQFNLITANNVFAHVDDLDDAIEGVKILLAPGGVFSMQVSYLPDVIDGGHFDTIYHEHLDYHTVGPLVRFFAKHALCVFDVEHDDFYGGSVRLLIGREQRELPSVEAAMRLEHANQMDRMSTFLRFAMRIDWARDQLLPQLNGGAVGFGAPAKLTTLMYQFGLDADDVRYVVDDTSAKQGRYTPGLNIPIKPVSEIGEPEAVLVFAWNCADAIKEQHPGYNYIVPRFRL